MKHRKYFFFVPAAACSLWKVATKLCPLSIVFYYVTDRILKSFAVFSPLCERHIVLFRGGQGQKFPARASGRALSIVGIFSIRRKNNVEKNAHHPLHCAHQQAYSYAKVGYIFWIYLFRALFDWIGVQLYRQWWLTSLKQKRLNENVVFGLKRVLFWNKNKC